MKETILLFHAPDKDTLLKIEMALFPLHVRLRRVAKEDYVQPLGALAGVKDIPRIEATYEGDELSDTLFVFAFFSDNRLNQALAALRKSGAGTFPYKAILTPTNQNWNALQCFSEIRREHETIQKQLKGNKEQAEE